MPSPAPANQTLTLLAGIGVLLLAMGVGVLIGRSSGSSPKAPASPVITVAQSGTGSTGTAASSEESFSGDWPSGTKGFTVQLQSLPEGTTVAAVAQAKTAAGSNGATSVGALKESEYSSLGGGGYLVYSGAYHKRPEAEKALRTLKSKFPGAKVVEVSNASGGGSTSAAGTAVEKAEAASAEKESKANLSRPAPSTALKTLGKAKGKNYEKESASLPNVVETK